MHPCDQYRGYVVISAVATPGDGALISLKRPPTFRGNQSVSKIKVGVAVVVFLFVPEFTWVTLVLDIALQSCVVKACSDITKHYSC